LLTAKFCQVTKFIILDIKKMPNPYTLLPPISHPTENVVLLRENLFK
jgi:hypothetical protein